MGCVRFLYFLCLTQKYSLGSIVCKIFSLFSYLVQWDSAIKLHLFASISTGGTMFAQESQTASMKERKSPHFCFSFLLLPQAFRTHHTFFLLSKVATTYSLQWVSSPRAQLHYRTKISQKSLLYCLWRQGKEFFPSELLFCSLLWEPIIWGVKYQKNTQNPIQNKTKQKPQKKQTRKSPQTNSIGNVQTGKAFAVLFHGVWSHIAY